MTTQCNTFSVFTDEVLSNPVINLGLKPDLNRYEDLVDVIYQTVTHGPWSHGFKSLRRACCYSYWKRAGFQALHPKRSSKWRSGSDSRWEPITTILIPAEVEAELFPTPTLPRNFKLNEEKLITVCHILDELQKDMWKQTAAIFGVFDSSGYFRQQLSSWNRDVNNRPPEPDTANYLGSPLEVVQSIITGPSFTVFF